MKILGAIIRTDEVIGCSALAEIMEGNMFYLEFAIVTRGSSLLFQSKRISDVGIATRLELEYVAWFRKEYAGISEDIGLLIEDDFTIRSVNERDNKIAAELKSFVAQMDMIDALLEKSKIKNKETFFDLLGNARKAVYDIRKQL